MSFFKKLFAKVAPSADLTQIDEKAEADFNKAFADLVTEQVSAATTDFQARIKALEEKEMPQAFDATALTQKIEGLEKALETTKAESETKVIALVTELQDIKAGASNKPKANSKIPVLNTTQSEGAFTPPALSGF